MTVLIRLGDGTPLRDGEFGAVIKVRGEHTGGAMAVLEQTVPPGRLIAPHTHQNDVWVYVLTGEVGVLVGDAVVSAGPGEWALKPRDVLHAMWNASATPARIIEVLTPAGSERWFEEISSLDPDDPEAFEAACARHGIRFYRDSPWTEELGRRFGVKPG